MPTDKILNLRHVASREDLRHIYAAKNLESPSAKIAFLEAETGVLAAESDIPFDDEEYLIILEQSTLLHCWEASR